MRYRFASLMLVNLIMWSAIASCNSAQTARPEISQSSPHVLSQSSDLSELEQTVHDQINQYRLSRRLPPLTLDERISQPARQHSQAMATGETSFGHDGFDQRAERIEQLIPYQSIAENVGFNQGVNDPVTQAVQGWIDSEGHRQNIEGDYDLTGVGVATNAQGEYFFTQLFVRRQ